MTLRYFRFEEEEYRLLNLLDGVRSADSIQKEFEAEFAPQRLTYSELFQFIGMLFRQSLLISNATGQGRELHFRGHENRKKKFRASLGSILSLRLRGFDPGATLRILDRWFGWFFSLPVACFCIALMLAALGLIFSQFEHFMAKLPEMQSFFHSKNWIWLSLVLVVTKVLHELGHGLSCQRLGGQCHEMGIMFLVLMPCLYCNVSDSWMLNNKWRRIGIAIAGIYVELTLAAVATFVWWFSQPGLINQLALNVMFVCSVSTILFNANPLMRFDGYYILSDLIEVPNLRQKATNVMQRFFKEVCLGLPAVEDPFLPSRNRWLFAIYCIAALAYRWVLTFTIFWFLYNLLEPYGFKLVGQILAIFVLYGLFVLPLIQIYRFFSIPGRVQAVKPTRFAISVAVVAVLIVGITLIPLPHRVTCEFYLEPAETNRVYIEVPGALAEIGVEKHQQVKSGQVIARLVNHAYDQNVERLYAEVAKAQAREYFARTRAGIDPSVEFELASIKSLIQSNYDQYLHASDERKRLEVTAPASGIFYPPAFVPKPKEDDGRLKGWWGNVLDSANLGAWLETGTQLGEIVSNTEQLEAILAINQADVEFIRKGQRVDLWCRQHPQRFYPSSIEQISPSKMRQIPRAMAADFGGTIHAKTTANNTLQPVETIYQVSVIVHNDDDLLLPGSTGVARIHAGYSTIGQRLWRLVLKTFRFDL
ncbi:MAG TPA: HlyD family efflux transporter periplasmic adaptor subunit [Pirellulaceae bacterium]|nr:HlyD family efflux transporter periplasmic adaptor subunit [Pirellulaceae bacterium]HMO93215.1 HlyD family efflux transporter periplasmic adaptor subunit [Pirellulaceae bacterium]HMP70046.1 HlyD family efflux transporter periplasmic adaptor subunit [Pirellulaceae bacterium]